jgi:hypothetical protein
MSEQFDWRSAAAARGLKVTDLAEHVATSIEGIDLADDHDEEMIAIIRAACVARTLLLFRGQGDLSPAGYLAFANRFGGRPDLHSLRHYCLPESAPSRPLRRQGRFFVEIHENVRGEDVSSSSRRPTRPTTT